MQSITVTNNKMEIKIEYQGTLEPFENVKSTSELESTIKYLDGVDSVKVSHFFRDSIDYPTITTIVLTFVAVNLQVAKFIYDIIQNRSQNKNNNINITANNVIINFNSSSSIEDIQKELNELNK